MENDIYSKNKESDLEINKNMLLFDLEKLLQFK
jgi:hypothetical protein